jgi:NADH dehydrogenase
MLAVPSWERKIRVLTVWLTAAAFGRDLVSLASVQHPRDAFVTSGDPRRPEENPTSARTAV